MCTEARQGGLIMASEEAKEQVQPGVPGAMCTWWHGGKVMLIGYSALIADDMRRAVVRSDALLWLGSQVYYCCCCCGQ